MTIFEQGYFRKFKFTQAQVDQTLRNARRDLQIAQEDAHREVRFTYSYQALIKVGLALIAKQGYKVRSVPGHHVKLLVKMSDLLSDPDILAIGDAMRMKRNDDFYGGGVLITEKEAADYMGFVRRVVGSAERLIRGRHR